MGPTRYGDAMNLPPPPPPPATSHGSEFGAFGPPPAPPAANLAGFGRRLVGRILDSVLYGLAAAVLFVPGAVLTGLAFEGCETITYADNTSELLCDDGYPKVGLLVGGLALMLASVLVVAVIYIRALARTGQTWGRTIVGIRVIRLDNGDSPGVGKALGRTLFSQFISGWLFGLGYLWMLWDDRNQTWHDKVAGTLVVKV
jgi:uncharacterized RDD family membrane protein YckC